MVWSQLGSIAISLVAVLIAAAPVAADRPARAKAVRSRPVTAGVGIALKLGKEYLEIGKILPDTPAARSGKIHPGDRIIAIGDGIDEPVSTKRMSIPYGVGMIRGIPGTIVTLTILPPNKPEKDAFVVTLTRGTIKELTRIMGDGEYIAVGAEAPNLKGVVLPEGKNYELNNESGRIVVVEFWAMWCGQCLQAIDHLQQLRHAHPEWKNRVSFLVVAADDAKEGPAKYVATKKQEWDGLTAIWSGPEALKDFHVEGLPVVYVIDAQGKVVAADHRLDLESILAGKPPAPRRLPIYHQQADAKADITAALATANREKKRVLLDFGGNWCGPCFKLHDVFTKNAEVSPILDRGFVLVLVDVHANPDLLVKYLKDERQPSYPYLVVLDADGTVLRNQQTKELSDGPNWNPARVKAFLEKWASPE